MSETPTLRQTERDLTAAAEEIRTEEIPTIKERIGDLEAKTRALPPEKATPDDWEKEYQQLKEQVRELAGTADTYDHYAEAWTESGDCVFTLEELNGDEWAATIDAVRAEGQNQGGSIPEGYGRVKALEFGVEDIPEGWPADPGVWPAPVVNELFEALESITAPKGVDLGNDSLASVRENTTDAAQPAATETDRPDPTTPPAEVSPPE